MSSLPLPNEGDLESLPYFALLALGARCAQRVAPVFGSWDEATQEQVRAVSRAARAVEELAASPSMVSRMPLWVSARQSTKLAADVASAADMGEAPHPVLCAADAAAELAGAIDPDGDRAPAARAVRRTVQASLGALDDPDGTQGRAFLDWFESLVSRLQSRASSEGWTNESAVSIPGE